MWDNGNSFVLAGMQSGSATWKDSLSVSYKSKHALTMWSSCHAPWYLPKGNESTCPHKSLNTGV